MVSLESRLRGAIEFWRGNDTPPGPDAIGVLTRLLTQAEKIRHPLLAEQARTDEQTLVSLTETQFRYLRFLRGQRRAAIAGCAGSGKTFLALEKARRLTQDEGLKVLFVCYNRALADYLGDGLGYRRLFDVFSFHQLCVHLGNQAGQHLTYQEEAPPEYFKTTLPNAILAGIDKLGSQYDTIIVDEGQDFRSEWWDPLPWLLQDPAQGILYVFYDDNQRVYRDRSPIPIETSPFVLDENCRNTQCVFDVVGRFYQGAELPAVLGPVGQPAEIVKTSGERDALAVLRKTLHRLVNENGFKPEEIAVLTARGVDTSGVLGQRLGNFQLTEQLPLAPGEIFATTVRRFKGLERAAIVVCEVDGQLPLQDVEMLLYVGTSRAKTYLVVLVDQNAPPVVRKALMTSHSGGDNQS